MDQEDILHKILTKNRELEELQNDINKLVLENRERVKEKGFDDGYTESIESYYC